MDKANKELLEQKRKLLESKLKAQKVRNILKAIKGINVLRIYEETDAPFKYIWKNIFAAGYYSYKRPDSKISYRSEDQLFYQWVIENMKLKKGDIQFLDIEGIWAKIEITDVLTAVRSLWENCRGIVLLNENMDKLLEVGSDSRDEYNFLFDEYIITDNMLRDLSEAAAFRKIIVIGSSGAGKSTFARKLRDITGLPLYFMDMIWHKPDKTHISREEFDKKLNDILSMDKWIIDGNYQRTLETRLEKCDTVFFLRYPLDVCLSGIEQRIGTKREDMPWIETEFDEEFRQWVIDFEYETVPKIFEMLNNYRKCKDKTIIVFRSREEADNYLKELRIGK